VPLLDAPAGNCSAHFRKLAVDVDGNVFPCCSPGGFTEPLNLGNAGDADLGALFRRSQSSGLLAILEEVGPNFFFPFVRAAGADGDLPSAFRDQCHLCHALLSSAEALPVVNEVTGQLLGQLAAAPDDASTVHNARMRHLLNERAALLSQGA
jgi:hypothetical protein